MLLARNEKKNNSRLWKKVCLNPNRVGQGRSKNVRKIDPVQFGWDWGSSTGSTAKKVNLIEIIEELGPGREKGGSIGVNE